MVSLCRYFLFALAISTTLSNCEAKLHEVTEEQLQNFHKAHGQKQRHRAKAAANETLLTAVKKIGDTCYSGTDCDSGQFCGLVNNNYYSSSSNCKFCDSYDPTISYDIARDREYNICGSQNKVMFYGRCLEPMEKKVDDIWFDWSNEYYDYDYDNDYYDYQSGLGFPFDSICWAKGSKDCCEPNPGAVGGVVAAAVIFFTALAIIIAFFCKCCCFKKREEPVSAV
jgi:hypothetical protein